MKASLPVLYYVHDPMCSWCWGFRPVWQQVQQTLKASLEIRYLLGGLATDTDQPMPQAMQQTIRQTWMRIQQEIPGTEFNFDFWHRCLPRRATYMACRAIIAAGMQHEKSSATMLSAIQQAYYLQARNPSDTDTLLELAREIGLDGQVFRHDLLSDECDHLFLQQRKQAVDLGVSSFPSLVLSKHDSNTMIYIDYNKSETIVSSILALI